MVFLRGVFHGNVYENKTPPLPSHSQSYCAYKLLGDVYEDQLNRWQAGADHGQGQAQF